MPTPLEEVQQIIQDCQNEVANARIANTKPDLVKLDRHLLDALDIIKNVLLPNEQKPTMIERFVKMAKRIIPLNK